MKKNAEQTKERIMGAGRRVLRQAGAFRFTVDLVASEAKCAKGLIHYHFGTKAELLRSLLARASRDRIVRWRTVLAVDDARDAVTATWGILTEEASEGELFGGGLSTISGELRDLGVETQEEFARALGDAVDGLMRRTGLKFDVPAAQVGSFVSANVTGTIVRLASGGDRHSAEEGYALAWLGLLSLTRPA